MKRKKWFNMQSLLSISAFVMSVCAIVISFAEVRMMAAQKEASVWPRLFSARTTSNHVFEVTVRNAGVGPAQIKYVEVRVDDKVVTDWHQVLDRISPEAKYSTKQSTLTNYVLVPGERISPITINGDDMSAFTMNTKRLRMKICYCSIYDNCWVLDESIERQAGLAVPYKVDACYIDSNVQFKR